MECQRIDSSNRERINAFLREHWFTTTMVLRGREIDMTKADGFYFSEGCAVIGLITYLIYGGTLEILSLDSLRENQGIGSALLERVIREARALGLAKIVLITTNDNTEAMRFYQKRGFDMARVFRNALEVSRKLKPEIPLIGAHGIPLRHEIELELALNKGCGPVSASPLGFQREAGKLPPKG